jgi:hypothetical protein
MWSATPASIAESIARCPEFLPPPKSANDFHDAHDNTQKPSHNEQVNKGACEADNQHECDDFPSSEHGFLAAHRAGAGPIGEVGQIPMLTCSGFWQ